MYIHTYSLTPIESNRMDGPAGHIIMIFLNYKQSLLYEFIPTQ